LMAHHLVLPALTVFAFSPSPEPNRTLDEVRLK